MTGLKLWMLLLFLHGTNGVEYYVKNDGEQEVKIFFKDFSLLPEGIMHEGISFSDIIRANRFGPKWLDQTEHSELFVEICRELEGESITSLRLDHCATNSVTLRVIPSFDGEEDSPQMERYLNDLSLRVIRVVETHFKIKCSPTTEEDEKWFSDELLPPAPVLPPEGWQPFLLS
ncbi:MAG: hypothetical protein IT410_01785 [Candidatus Doudnabacteria bacterium]|nr:hypothetical protein [Candidatus Doudnabacteria bacterium]